MGAIKVTDSIYDDDAVALNPAATSEGTYSFWQHPICKHQTSRMHAVIVLTIKHETLFGRAKRLHAIFRCLRSFIGRW